MAAISLTGRCGTLMVDPNRVVAKKRRRSAAAGSESEFGLVLKRGPLPASVDRNGHQRPADRGDQLASLITRVADLRSDRDRLEQIVGSRTQQ